LQAKLDEFHVAGAEVLAISADPRDKLNEELAPKGITFPLLSDPDLRVIDAYGLRHPGGNPFGGDIARPAIFVLDSQGRIVWRALTDNWRVRPTAQQVLEEVRRAG